MKGSGEQKPKVRTTAVSTDDKTVWAEAMKRIQKKDITAWSFLSQGSLVSSAGSQYHWQASQPEGEMQYITALNRDDRKKMICGILNEITGNDCGFTADRHSQAAAEDGSDDAYLASIYETFGHEPVDIVDEIK